MTLRWNLKNIPSGAQFCWLMFGRDVAIAKPAKKSKEKSI